MNEHNHSQYALNPLPEKPLTNSARPSTAISPTGVSRASCRCHRAPRILPVLRETRRCRRGAMRSLRQTDQGPTSADAGAAGAAARPLAPRGNDPTGCLDHDLPPGRLHLWQHRHEGARQGEAGEAAPDRGGGFYHGLLPCVPRRPLPVIRRDRGGRNEWNRMTQREDDLDLTLSPGRRCRRTFCRGLVH